MDEKIIFESGVRSEPTGFSKLTKATLDADGAALLEDAVKAVEDKLEHEPPFFFLGNPVHMRRNVGFFSYPEVTYGYFYAGSCSRTQALPPQLRALVDYVNKKLDSAFNGVLVNYYADGRNYISKHSDKEKGLDKTAGVVALSYGATRKMLFTPKAGAPTVGRCQQEVDLDNNSVVRMQGAAFQDHWEHEIRKELRVKEGRYSFTFRVHDGKNEKKLIEQYLRTKAKMDALEAGADEAPAKKQRVAE